MVEPTQQQLSEFAKAFVEVANGLRQWTKPVEDLAKALEETQQRTQIKKAVYGQSPYEPRHRRRKDSIHTRMR